MSDDQPSKPPPSHNEEAEERPATAPVTDDPIAAAAPEEDTDAVLEVKDILEIMEYEASQEADAEALLGGQNDSVCTYLEGYKPRQALYSCRTCAAETGQDNGVCYACTLHCHDDHDLVELYTKRNFCCDCGNGKFQKKCTLFEAKTPSNHRNTYNQNFKGLYCVCKRPYPPPPGEETQDAEMVQCTLCEEWFHVNHLENFTKTDKPVTSVIESQDGVAASTNQPEASQSSANSQSTQSSFVLFSATPSATQSTASQQQSEEQDDDWDMREVFCQDCTKKFPFLLVYFYHHFKGLKMPEVVAGECVYQKIRPESIETLPAGAIEFDSYKWREALCRCENCTAFYEEKKIDFLPEFEDTTYAYYKQNRETAQASKKPSDLQIYESAMEYTGGNRDVALIAMKEWMHMQEKMAKWIAEKAARGEVIQKEDVHAMFQELRETRLFKVPDEAMDTSTEKPPQ